MRRGLAFGSLIVAILAVGAGPGCTEVVDTAGGADATGDGGGPGWAVQDSTGGGPGGGDTTGGGHDVGPPPDPACVPDPCALLNQACVDGDCVGCKSGYHGVDGFCVPAGDPCDPDPCSPVHKVCINGFCGGCLEGYMDDGAGHCMEPSPCWPNPCTAPVRTWCQVDDEGLALCQCDPGAHDDGFGHCTFDPCMPDPCEPPLTECSAQGPFAVCGCPAGTLPLDGDCVDDPCDPNPCKGYARTVCALDPDDGHVACGCDPGFEAAEAGGCVEGPFVNLEELPEPDGPVEIGHARQLLVDDWLVQSRPGLVRRLHPAVRLDQGWALEADEVADIGRARANGSLVHLDDEARAALPVDDPLRDWPWRLYYMGYRQLYTFDSQPSWLCVAVADDPAGPWERPALLDDPEDPAPHCILRDDGLVTAEITRTPSGWVMSATRLALGAVGVAGMYLYTSDDGVQWTLGNDEQPLVGLATEAVAPGAYARAGDRSRLVRDPADGRWRALLHLPSALLGDARGTQSGKTDPTAGWSLSPDPLTAPAILAPTAFDLSAGRVYGDMTAWRVGSLWLGLVHRRHLECPKKGHVILAASRDGRDWIQVVDEMSPQGDAILPSAQADGQPDSSLATLSGGAPAETDGSWHFLVGGTTHGPCGDTPAPGGIVRLVGRAGGLAGLQATGAEPAKLFTRPLVMAPGAVASTLHLDAFLADKVTVHVEALTDGGVATGVASTVVPAGDHRDAKVSIQPLNAVTAGAFRLRLTFAGGGEVFGFRFADPACSPNPCLDLEIEGKTTCDSSTGQAVCVCDPPTHDDGLGGCTEAACLPDPCTGLHQEGCAEVDGAAVCGCEEGWVVAGGLCVADPCQPADGQPAPCPPPGPAKCSAVDGVATCYCPEGSVAGPTGCLETDARAFVTSLKVDAAQLGGVAGADQLCGSLGAAAGLPGSYGAWLSAPGASASSRFAGGGPWRTWDPDEQLWVSLVAAGLGDLTDGSIAHPLSRTEFGAPVDDKCIAWTGTTADGHAVDPGELTAQACHSWTAVDPPGFALVGLCQQTDATWTEWAPAACDKKLRVYCLELPGVADLE